MRGNSGVHKIFLQIHILVPDTRTQHTPCLALAALTRLEKSQQLTEENTRKRGHTSLAHYLNNHLLMNEMNVYLIINSKTDKAHRENTFVQSAQRAHRSWKDFP